jgi:hypothetical protein
VPLIVVELEVTQLVDQEWEEDVVDLAVDQALVVLLFPQDTYHLNQLQWSEALYQE